MLKVLHEINLESKNLPQDKMQRLAKVVCSGQRLYLYTETGAYDGFIPPMIFTGDMEDYIPGSAD